MRCARTTSRAATSFCAVGLESPCRGYRQLVCASVWLHMASLHRPCPLACSSPPCAARPSALLVLSSAALRRAIAHAHTCTPHPCHGPPGARRQLPGPAAATWPLAHALPPCWAQRRMPSRPQLSRRPHGTTRSHGTTRHPPHPWPPPIGTQDGGLRWYAWR
mmetsp:Transcript_5501/g.14512  ORF Transcript_5501/g.14512 Transcript_5501/m.14512 type:complete len:162 (-) Transcript_5501:256-741(-)